MKITEFQDWLEYSFMDDLPSEITPMQFWELYPLENSENSFKD